MQRLKIAWVVPLCVSCVGQISQSDPPDAAPAQVDAGPEPATYKVTGSVHDYAELDALADTAVTTLGLDPPISATSDATGAYTLMDVPPGSAFFVSVMPSGTTYRPTINPSVSLAASMVAGDVTLDLQAISSVYAQRQSATAGVPVAPMTAIVIVELEKPDGSPWEGMPAAAFTIEPDGGGTPVGLGPYFVGTNGDVDPALTTSTAFNDRARAVFLNVPAGRWTLFARGTSGAGGMMMPDAGLPGADAGTPDAGLPGPDAAPPAAPTLLASAALIAAADATVNGATLVLLQKIGGMGDGGGGPLSFATDIYPLLQKASQGGQGCASCHTAGGAAGGVLILNDGAAAVYSRLLADPMLVNLPSPADSELLTKPLYESPPNHPNATWLDTADPAYRKVLSWITQGAPQ